MWYRREHEGLDWGRKIIGMMIMFLDITRRFEERSLLEVGESCGVLVRAYEEAAISGLGRRDGGLEFLCRNYDDS